MQAFADRHNVTLDAACLDTHRQCAAEARPLRGGRGDAAPDPRRPTTSRRVRSRDWLRRSTPPPSAQRLQGHMEDAGATLDRCIELCAARGMLAIHVEALEERARLYRRRRDCSSARTSSTSSSTPRTRHCAPLSVKRMRARSRRSSKPLKRGARASASASCHSATRSPACATAVTSTPSCPSCWRARERTARSLSIGLVDLDKFKDVNDRFSHAVGDNVLVRVSGILAAATAESGWAARMGGEEFLLVFPAIEHRRSRCDAVRMCVKAIESVRWDGVMTGERRHREHRVHHAAERSHEPGSAARSGRPQPLCGQAPGKESSSLRLRVTADLHDHSASRSRASRR